MIHWELMPVSVASWREAGQFDAGGLPQPTGPAWLAVEAPAHAVLAVLHIGVAACFAARCPHGPQWCEDFGEAAAGHVRRYIETGDEDELAFVHGQFDAALKMLGAELLRPEMAGRALGLRQSASA